ncbi:hypothetical protein NEMIN01_0128 [Nematocida minor]|uniref:uncharacterized protein n=1 Tax=Nematocida minor TaxID=1912983 RepID=UPI00221E8EFA|nr:uncharacterized protein NEMIN01_0024 [Nematocida minor]XP_051332030.1 uncharacterized protein NEMIN01_0128 [Nematocida minor]KAI5188760.1 hypothetical protein NEMIN01_0024 [Nematocida minor]KAI5188864.1 hypothetical protein NEMIN01_0128 [Nematocida minor]
MQASQHIRQLSIQLKQYLKQCKEKNQFSPELAKNAVMDSLAPLAELPLDQACAPRTAPPVEGKASEDPYIYALITEHLCRSNAIQSARTLLEEMEEMFPLKEETERVDILKAYCPWSDELGKKPSHSITRKSSRFQQICQVKEKCASLIENYRENPFPLDIVSNIYRIINDSYIEPLRLPDNFEKKELLLQDTIDNIQKCFIEENDTILYFDGKTGHVYAKSSKSYKEVQIVLSLLVFPHRCKEVERLLRAKRVDWPVDAISLETLYYVGKAMESINLSPYSCDGEIESAVPPALSFHSTFFCPILRTECSVDNAPCILTCGHAISIRALEKIASFKGMVFKCPYCPKDANIKDVSKAKLFI